MFAPGQPGLRSEKEEEEEVKRNDFQSDVLLEQRKLGDIFGESVRLHSHSEPCLAQGHRQECVRGGQDRNTLGMFNSLKLVFSKAILVEMKERHSEGAFMKEFAHKSVCLTKQLAGPLTMRP